MKEMTFQDAVQLMGNIHSFQQPEICTDAYARFQDARYEDVGGYVMFQRLLNLEQCIHETYPHLRAIAYEANQYGDRTNEIEVIIEEKNDVFVLYVRTAAIEEDDSLGTALYSVYVDDEDWLLEDVPRSRLYISYPKLEDIVLSYVQNLPAYRLHMVTRDIEIDKWKEEETTN